MIIDITIFTIYTNITLYISYIIVYMVVVHNRRQKYMTHS